jgi:hypothetical protein
MTTYQNSRPRHAQKEAAGPVIQETDRARHANINSTTQPTTSKRQSSTLLETVDALENIHAITGVRIVRFVDRTGEELGRFVFPPRGSKNILTISDSDTTGLIRFRLLLERIGLKPVGTQLLIEALRVADLPVVPWEALKIYMQKARWSVQELDALLKGGSHGT